MIMEKKLADTLRALLACPGQCDCGPQGCGVAECRDDQREAIETAARATLAEYDARPAPGPHTRTPWAPVTGTDGRPMAQHPRMTSELHNGGYVFAIFPGPEGDAWQARAIACVNACDGIEDPAGMVRAFKRLSSYVGGHDEKPGHPCRVASDILSNVASLEDDYA